MPINVSLVMFKSDGTRRDFPVTREKVLVGRKNDCDLRIPLTSVSRKHCEFRVDEDQVKMRDLGSSNGTYHNNIRVQEAVLSAGDEVVVGPVVFTIVVDGQPEEIKPVRTILESASDEGSTPSPAFSKQPQEEEAGESAAVRGEALDDSQTEEPEHVEAEQTSPTVDLDDPVSALAAINDGDESDEESGQSGPDDANDASGSHVGQAHNGTSQSDDQDNEIELLDDDESQNATSS